MLTRSTPASTFLFVFKPEWVLQLFFFPIPLVQDYQGKHNLTRLCTVRG